MLALAMIAGSGETIQAFGLTQGTVPPPSTTGTAKSSTTGTPPPTGTPGAVPTTTGSSTSVAPSSSTTTGTVPTTGASPNVPIPSTTGTTGMVPNTATTGMVPNLPNKPGPLTNAGAVVTPFTTLKNGALSVTTVPLNVSGPTPVDPTLVGIYPNTIGQPGVLGSLEASGLAIFGTNFFEEARTVIDARRQAALSGATPFGQNPLNPPNTSVIPNPNVGTPSVPSQNPAVNGGAQIDPRSLPVGPDGQPQFTAATSVPERYQLGAGDVLTVRVTSRTSPTVESRVRVEPSGVIAVPNMFGIRAVVRGQTLGEAQQALTQQVRRFLKDATVTLELSELRTMTIRVLGEAYAPGSYQVSAAVTLFNALYQAGGPNPNGSYRNIQLKRLTGATKTVDLYKLLIDGDSTQDTTLQPGDVILIPAASKYVIVRGEVRRPAIYELKGSERLRDAVRLAGGARPSGVTQNILVDSVRPGVSRQLLDINIASRDPENNPPLYDGDVVEIFSIRPTLANLISVEGAVDQPRNFAFREGMTVSEAITLARGLLPEAYTGRVDVFRQNPDKSLTLLNVDLEQALKKDPTADIKLLPNDRIVVYKQTDIQFLSTRRLILRGAVQRPGTYYRAEGETVRDLLIQAGGLLPTANTQEAALQRTNPDGTPGPIIKINLGLALTGQSADNIPLKDNDEVTVYTVGESRFVGDQIVEITGAVQRPGTFVRSEDMRVSDLLLLAGGLLPTANNRAFVQRVNENGTQGPLFPIDLKLAVAGDPRNDILLAPKDRVSVFSITEAQYQTPQTVEIQGAVQRPGVFPSSSNMTLADLVALAGGALPTASESIEITRAWAPIGTPVTRVKIADVLAGSPEANIVLQPGDTVTLAARSDVVLRPRIVNIVGAVKFPGPYQITGQNDRLSELVRRAGGLTDSAFPTGAEFVRDPKLLQTARQIALNPILADTFRLVSEDEYKRASALVDMDRLRIVFSQGSTLNTNSLGALSGAGLLGGGGGGSRGSNVETGESTDQAIAKALSSEAVTRSRVLTNKELVPSGNLNVNMNDALKRPNSKDDPVLMDGDVIVVPETPTTITVSGAVVLPSAVLFQPGANIDYYVTRAGGLLPDASVQSILVVRANGSLIRYKPGMRFELGDNIIIPTKVMVIRLQERANALTQITNGLTSAGITIALIKAIGG